MTDWQTTDSTGALSQDAGSFFSEPEQPSAEELRKQIASEERYLETRYSSLGAALRKTIRGKIAGLKDELKKTESGERRSARAKAQAERLAEKLGEKEAKRLNSAKNRILEALKAAGSKGCSNKELSEIALNYGARVRELRNDGWEIPDTRIDNGVFRYVLDVNKSTAWKASPSCMNTESAQESGNAN